MAKDLEKSLKIADQRCIEQGLRLTPQRRQVMGLLLEQEGPRSAYDLLDELQSRHQPGAKPPTIYRALDFLVSAGLAHRLASTNRYLACGHLACDHGHERTLFLVCDQCGAVREATMDTPLKQALNRSLSQEGFTAGTQPMEMHGRCRACR
ncbi:transcriptional repressor [Alloalcanivorax mobilis]|uniref:transcriptional repressor n=1 Tax=Alloalcanivorax mobilis TaxID=2019569 RepID=UPI000B5B326B|nr:transcriptional repressor [Alloalcanivorax mobilis]ASK34747.1 Fur family transcriptional regulator [Alcanivorax sp. N3-2A]|tara:strand:+ start:10210 stop:10662 length:453 start_codon:yes stop_codon:yes gene_type:complete